MLHEIIQNTFDTTQTAQLSMCWFFVVLDHTLDVSTEFCNTPYVFIWDLAHDSYVNDHSSSPDTFCKSHQTMRDNCFVITRIQRIQDEYVSRTVSCTSEFGLTLAFAFPSTERCGGTTSLDRKILRFQSRSRQEFPGFQYRNRNTDRPRMSTSNTVEWSDRGWWEYLCWCSSVKRELKFS